MQPLAGVVGDARLVALGEATHGTREFFQFKHRMVEFLASQEGFTIFSIEANMPEAYRLNDFVLKGEGDPKQLLKGLYFWTWDTEEVLNMILWMREFNRQGKGRIEFTGFDMQTPKLAMKIVQSFVATNDKAYEATIDPIYDEVMRRTKQAPSDEESASQKLSDHLLARKCRDVTEHLAKGRAGFLRSGLEVERVDWAIQNARMVMQYALLQSGEQSRDESMAENVEWIADHNPGAKIVLWAANGHVRYTAFPEFNPMGLYLRKRFGKGIVNFGFCFGEGSFRAVETGRIPREFTVKPLPKGSLDGTLASSGIPLFALDLRNLPKDGPVARWFAKPRAMRNIGAVYSEKGGDSPDPIAITRWPAAFDVILFVEKTTAAHGNE
ncbi:MAG TPA: erythromycin esterase family protein [Candidatus Acidoferrales bacterium]|nr:erythromycin esterase family protein [Candidatus Acidoferrales bacterium]